MDNIKYGIKLWSINEKYLKGADVLINDGHFDYIELMVLPNSDIKKYVEMDTKFIIHVAHDEFGANIGKKEAFEITEKCTNEALYWADKLDAKYIILHPGYGEIKNAIDFLSNINDRRILIENMTKISTKDENMICYTYDQIKKIMGEKYGFCMDFSHAIKASCGLGKNYKEFVKELLKLKPKVFHISDGWINNEKDEHLDIGSGNFDMKFIKKCITENPGENLVTLETPKNIANLKNDVDNLRRFRSS